MLQEKSFADPCIIINSDDTLASPPRASFGLHSPRSKQSVIEPMPSIYSAPPKVKWVRLAVLLIGMIFLAIGREAVPDHDVNGIVDRLMDVFNGANAYVTSSPFLRNFMLIVCSLFMDITFLTTGTYWIFYGTTSRFFVALPIFYIMRALVQQMWYSPYPPNYYWDYPGFPSLVVPYGRSSDFYFSGHIGFIVLNASEWVMNKKPWAAVIVALGGVYTALVLLIFQAHYSIDIFTGIICASWVFIIVNMYKDKFDALFATIFLLFNKLLKIVFKRNCDNEMNEKFLDEEKFSRKSTEVGSY